MKRLLISLDARPYCVPEPINPHRGPSHPGYLTAFQSQAKRHRNRRRMVALAILGFLSGCAVSSETSIGGQASGASRYLLHSRLQVGAWRHSVSGSRAPRVADGWSLRMAGIVRNAAATSSTAAGTCATLRNRASRPVPHATSPSLTRRTSNPAPSFLVRGCTHGGVPPDVKGV
jgi:hypothetical protein